MKKSLRKTIFCLFALLIVVLLMKIDRTKEIFGADNSLMTKAFEGTYSCESNPICHVIADPNEGNVFYYSNPSYEVYLKGEFEKGSSDEYLLTGNEIESQNIIIEHQRFSLYVDEVKLDFKKISEIPTYPADIEELAK